MFIIINQTNNHATLLLFLIFLLSYFSYTNSYVFIYAGCSQEKFQPSSPFESTINSFLTSVVTSSSQTGLYNTFTPGDSSPSTSSSDSPIYGLYQCRGDLRPSDCTSCIQSAVTQIGLICPYSYGATLQLEGCYVRYEKFNFLGKPDNTVMYKRCSRSSSDDAEFFRRREDVLATIQGAVNGFRASSSGSVQGFGQCLGDLNSNDCSNCLNEAVKELKTLCGQAAAAHVFLAKCYAEYWEAGYYDLSTHSSEASHDDEVAKTVAIIVGIIGGVAILIVLLSVCRKSAPGGK
ncbi:cysteine-rich repeat secretory protein 15-like [Chenopodium quinoa]|uniref:cysteine-rich repeat secretory protein 15-like n=1 Tax=Chenopodium quinoa TaxID=63459 RepID=UPI000B78D6C7|nr:cysteine-rich repeat secretory protein 15-like [Chenopodium quinoa]